LAISIPASAALSLCWEPSVAIKILSNMIPSLS
jgi:hypothetical protein